MTGSSCQGLRDVVQGKRVWGGDGQCGKLLFHPSHLRVVPSPLSEVTHALHLTLIKSFWAQLEGQPPTSPNRQGALGGPPSQPQFPPRGLAQGQQLRGKQSSQSRWPWQGLSSNPRNEGLGVASSRNHPPQTLPDALQPHSASELGPHDTTGRRGGGDGVGPRGPKLLVISPTALLRHSHPHPPCAGWDRVD